jgi:hypothetical protein
MNLAYEAFYKDYKASQGKLRPEEKEIARDFFIAGYNHNNKELEASREELAQLVGIKWIGM